MKELKGERPGLNELDPEIERYTSRRLRELRIEHEIKRSEVEVDNVLFRGYTMATMEVYRCDD
tara:strand:- start:101 stop:289 length:189 start_codon:yes stop_codon:yes gene_type:complete